jgi:hypothetical protein
MRNEIKNRLTRSERRYSHPVPRKFVLRRYQKASQDQEMLITVPGGVAPYGSCWPVPDGAPPAASPKLVRNRLPDPFDFLVRAHAVWDNEGGAPRQDSIHSEYGKRIEADGSWTIYHVFSGVPATIGGDLMQGMNSNDALDQMTKTNLDNTRRRAVPTGTWKGRFLAAWWVRLSKHF